MDTPDPHTDPTAGEPQNTPETEPTPTDSGVDEQPQNAGPTPADLEARFDLGYGKGADKGRREVMGEYGIEGLKPEEVRAAIQAQQKADPEKASQASELAKLSQKVSEYEARLAVLEPQADAARVDKIRAVALEHGVIPYMVDDMVSQLDHRVRWNGSDLETLSRSSDGQMIPMGTPLSDMIAEYLAAKPAYVQPSGRTGAGSAYNPGTPEPPQASIMDNGDPRTLSERMAGK